ncbi:MAG TPA: ABC transporter permease [Anaerolineaceae bacterium]|nr:ABC transporter permease [Anaerolineaceae bacterium]
MRNLWIIARREYKQYFNSPIAYVVAIMFFLILGIIFYVNIYGAVINQMNGYDYTPGIDMVLSPMVTLLLFTTPALTMRAISDENRMGTMELILTSPVRDWELIVGKWLGAFLFMLTMIIVTWVFPGIMNQLIQPGIDQGIMFSGYLGIILLMGAFLAIGIAVSSFFSNQIASFFVTLAILLIVWMIGYPAQFSSGVGTTILSYLDFSEHLYDTFLKGIIEIKDVIYYLSATVFALFLGSASVEMRRWR